MTEQHVAAAHLPILVLGMHRSGTSAITRVIAALGAYPGETDELLPAHPEDNPTGYWERAALVADHDRFLQSTGHSWDRVAGFDARQSGPEAVRAMQEQLRGTIGSFALHGTPWVVKDPRLSLLLPLWLPLLDDVACVVIVRDPREIAASLRNTPRGVLTAQYPILLWEKYTRTMLRELTGRRALFVSYADFLADPQAQTLRLLQGLESLGVRGLSATSINAQELIDRNLYHREVEEHVALTSAQAGLYEWLNAQARAKDPIRVENFPSAPTPDAQLAEFEAAFEHHIQRGKELGGAETNRRLDRIESALTQQIREYHRRADEHDEERARLAAEVETQKANLQQEQAHLRQEQDKVRTLSQKNEAMLADLASLQRSRADTERHARRLQEAVDALRGSWSWKLSAPLRVFGKISAPRISWNAEEKLYRFYYGIPGLSPARKRAFVLWLHKHASWLTRHTFSYRLHEQTELIERQRTTDAGQRERMQRMDSDRADAILQKLKRAPLISIAMPVYNVDKRWLIAAVESVRKQFYPNWELCIADDASTRTETRNALDEVEALGDTRIKLRRLERNQGIAGASNAALNMAVGAFVGLLDHDDELTRDALLEVVQLIDSSDPDFIYSDEDKLDETGAHVEVHCKPDYSPDLFFSCNYLCHFSVLRRSLLTAIGGFRSGFDGAQDYDLFLRATERTDRVAHLRKVLYHWRKIAKSTAASSSAKPHSSASAQRAINESMQRRNIEAVVEPGPFPNTFRVRRAIHRDPLVSVLIPFRDKCELLNECVSSILEKSQYSNFEIVCIDNGSTSPETTETIAQLRRQDTRVRFLRYDAPFNYSEINNFGVAHCKGEHLLFLNNDTEIVSGEWIDAMLEHSQRPEVGVVGARLLYEDDTIQHAGVIVGLGGVAGHAHLFVRGEHPGYFARVQLIQNLSAVTFACAMTRRAVFEQLGGLNTADLKIAFNDIDFCLRAREAGYLVVYTPYAVLHHLESKSRGTEDTPEKQARFKLEVEYMQQRHKEVIEGGDPYYNPRLSLTNNFQPDPNYIYELPR